MAIIGANFSRNQTAATLRNEIIDDLMTLSDMAMHDEVVGRDSQEPCAYCNFGKCGIGEPMRTDNKSSVSYLCSTQDKPYGSVYLKTRVDFGDSEAQLMADGRKCYALEYAVKVNYCPKCGRKLS